MCHTLPRIGYKMPYNKYNKQTNMPKTLTTNEYKVIGESVKKTNRLVIIEEAWPLASISSEISHHIQRFAFDYLDAPVHRITCEDVPFHYAPTLIKEILPNVEKAMKAIKKVTYKN